MAHPLLARVALGGAVLLGASALTLPALAAGGQDPSGDNGTIKVHADAAGDDTRNQPHVGCEFTVALFGFDAGEEGEITFALQPPSGTRTLLSKHVLLSPDAAGGAGQDPDEVYAFTAAQLGVSGSERVHVKLTVTADDAHGKDKHKVFWLGPCETATAGESSTATATASESSSATATATASESSSATATATASESSSATATASESSSATATASESSSATATASESSSATATASDSSSATATASESSSATATATESTGGGVGGGTTGGGGTSGGGTAPGTVESGGTGATGGGEVSGGGVSGGVVGGVSGGGVSGGGNVGAGNVQTGGSQVLGEQYDTGTGAQGVLAHTGAAVGTVGALGAALLAAGAYLRRRTTRSRLQD